MYHDINLSIDMSQPKRRGTGGGGRGDDLYVRELIEPEKSVVLTGWRDFAVQDGGEKFTESIEILNKMVMTSIVESGWSVRAVPNVKNIASKVSNFWMKPSATARVGLGWVGSRWVPASG